MFGDAIRAYLGMKYHIVGIRILEEEREGGNRPAAPMRYCEMVKEAAEGGEYSARLTDMACPNSELTLGFRQPKYVEVEPRLKTNTKQVEIFSNLERDFDVALFVLTPHQVMTLSILLGGITADFRGELAVCGEATAEVINEGKPNVTFLCNGARMFGGYRENELVVGIPAAEARKLEEKVEQMVSVGGALCGCLVSDIPKEIIRNFQEIGFEKGADYFFGKIGDHSVRIYLNKDASGRFKLMTVHLPVKAKMEDIEVCSPFLKKERGNWVDVYTVIDPDQMGINLYTAGEKIVLILETLIAKGIEKA